MDKQPKNIAPKPLSVKSIKEREITSADLRIAAQKAAEKLKKLKGKDEDFIEWK